ncbi:lipoprotein-anchoring transpeptidase ErfK/SrfK [Rhodopseudomonas rhenobacensis]|uniref:Lipoprotein-anchoring transpeptidase ErfK/SrfK n=1 Tax=Rhodopseudomonas rhenobacensis TaxID=87461 RepID=A0A7W7Z510_9BRAD|nr:L,D-transpeptidase [Rhodopseudomonas rhenobacensis]MBB5048136.1 lipoprotein-anchoring transpeptidase ErfK/SrfK [Rhodopseudomonas rhenobacensis]
MTIKRILTILATVAASGAVMPVALAQSNLPAEGSYAAPEAYPPRGTSSMPDFDALDDEDGGRGPGSVALPAPGPVMSPDDPRYGRPAGAPVYSDRGAPSQAAPQGQPLGPVMSPDDPRYGRPAGPPPVIYSDRPAGPAPTYSDRGNESGRGPGAGFIYPGDDNRPVRPPEGVGAPSQAGAAPGGAVGNDGRPTTLAALPPEEQPEADTNFQLPPNLRRQEVAFPTKEPPGTLVVDTPNTHLYYVLGGGRAIRYGVRVGRDGFTWNGVQKVSRKAEWPDWHPPAEMIERQPYLPRFMAGGPGNPMGARAMYLGSTVYRIHGTNQPSTIGKFVSSGCIGMLNDDVSDLFDRVKVGTRVVVMPAGPRPAVPTTTAQAQPIGGPGAAVQVSPVPGTAPTVVPPLPAPVTVR